MRKNRCQLCGGRIRGGKCELCGWVNQEDREYLLNKSRCDDKPLTHVHKEQTFGSWDTGQKSKKSKKKPVKRKKRRPLLLAFVILLVLSVAVPLAAEVISGLAGAIQRAAGRQDPGEEYDAYQYVQRELSDSGDSWYGELTAGEYTAGVDIPEGNYRIEAAKGEGSFQLNDRENLINLYEYLEAEPSDSDGIRNLEDVRIYTNARIAVSGSLKLQLETENGQAAACVQKENPLEETIVLEKGKTAVAGKQFPAGVYDISAEDGFGIFRYRVPVPWLADRGTEEERLSEYTLFMDSDYGEDNHYTYHNLVLPEGTQVDCEDTEVILTPSSRIISEDYLEYYNW